MIIRYGTTWHGHWPKRRTYRRRIFCAAAPGADYALLSPAIRHYGYGASQRRDSVAGRPSQGRAALNELSAPVFTIHDVPHRGRRVRPQCGRQRLRICEFQQVDDRKNPVFVLGKIGVHLEYALQCAVVRRSRTTRVPTSPCKYSEHHKEPRLLTLTRKRHAFARVG
jgi:hypothetical protein